MSPSLGRIVHYVIPANDTPSGEPQVVPGIITRVVNETVVDLTLFPHQRPPAFASGIVQGSDDAAVSDNQGRWFWPPRV